MPLPAPDIVSSYLRSLPAAVLVALLCSPVARSQDVLTYHNNDYRNGLDNKETTLTLTNVNSASFGKLFTVSADGLVDAEPPYLSAVSIGVVTHNLLIVATEHGTVYAHDADTGARIWQITTLKSGAVSYTHLTLPTILRV